LKILGFPVTKGAIMGVALPLLGSVGSIASTALQQLVATV